MIKNIVKSNFKLSARWFCNQPKKADQIVSEPQQEHLIKQRKKSYVMPEQPQGFITYKPRESRAFKNGRLLIYCNKQNLITPYLISAHIIGPMGYLAVLIKKNPFYLTFPAALPLMFAGQFLLLMLYVWHKSHYKTHVQRIYLFENGDILQFVFSNKIRRILKNHPSHSVHSVAQMVSPETGENMAPLHGLPFPDDEKNIYYPSFKTYGWTKYLKDRSIYIIPAKPEYIDWELMVRVMHGIIIDTSSFTKEGQFSFTLPTLQEEQKKLLQQKKLKRQQKKQA